MSRIGYHETDLLPCPSRAAMGVVVGDAVPLSRPNRAVIGEVDSLLTFLNSGGYRHELRCLGADQQWQKRTLSLHCVVLAGESQHAF